MRLNLHTGVWVGSVGLWITGGLAMTTATLVQIATYRIGEAAVVAGVLLFVWGIKWDGDHWWTLLARRVTRRSELLFASPYMTPHEVTAYMAEESEWGRKLSAFEEHDPNLSAQWGAPVTEKKNPWLAAWTEFPRHAQHPDSPIKVFGTQEMSASPELIPPEFWLSNAPTLECCLEAGKPARTAPTVFVHGAPKVYGNLWIERAGVTKTWPKRKVKNGKF